MLGVVHIDVAFQDSFGGLSATASNAFAAHAFPSFLCLLNQACCAYVQHMAAACLYHIHISTVDSVSTCSTLLQLLNIYAVPV